MPTEIRRERLDLPTYDDGPENPNPWFEKRLGAYPYPYRLQNRLTGRRRIRSHEAVILENELLRLTFLPDVGCRLFSVYDKLLGREVFYRNDCIRPSLIAIRGAWISGGIEFNFPIGHAVYTHSRIPHMTRTNDDGSASMIFGLTEQMTGMRFTVEVRLAPGEYRFSECVRLYNGTPLPHRHYWWTNAGIRCTPETQLIYPLTWGISGSYGEKTPWPIHEGTDLSWARNHLSAGDIFAGETYDEFFGAYHHDLGFGIAHWARQEELPGRKMFFWGRDEMGKLWQTKLTDDAGDYMEIQAGRFATQGDFDLLQPHESFEFTEYWIPIGKTDGFVTVNPEGAINVTRERIAVQTTRNVRDAVLRVDGRDRRASFEAGVVQWFEGDDPSVIELLDRDDGLLMRYDAKQRDTRRDLVPRPKAEEPRPDANLHGDFAKAVLHCESDRDPIVLLLQAITLRKSGDTESARPLVEGLLYADPLWRHARWEQSFLGLADPPACEPECFQEDMDAAGFYFEMGLLDETGEIMTSWSKTGPPPDAFFDALAYELCLPIPDTRRDWPGIATCFPHRTITIPLLRRLGSPEAHARLGDLLYASGRTDDAIECWEVAIRSGIQDHLPYRNLALANWHKKQNLPIAYELMTRASDLAPRDADCLRDMDLLAELTGAHDDRPAIAERILTHAPNDSQCLERAIRIFIECGRLDEAVELLLTKQFFVAELAYQTRILYVRALLMRGTERFEAGRFAEAVSDFRRATEYPDNLGASRYHDSSDAQAHYVLGLALDADAQHDEALNAWMMAADDIAVIGSEQAFYVARARQRLGRADALDAIDAIRPRDEDAKDDQARARVQYLLGLSKLANGDSSAAHECLTVARNIEAADPVKLHNYLESVSYAKSEGRRIPIPVWWTVEPDNICAKNQH